MLNRKLILIIAIVLLGSVVGLRQLYALPDPQCGETSKNPCGPEKATAIAFNEQQIIKAATLTPYATNIPQVILDTPVPEGYVNPDDRGIEPVDDLTSFAPIPTLRQANSIWKAGVVWADDMSDYYRLFAWSSFSEQQRLTVVGTLLINSRNPNYTKTWIAPEYLGKVTITAIPESISDKQNPHGLIEFKTEDGRTGSVDFATGTWTISK